MTKLSNQGRIRLLTTASATVAAFALANAAQAAETVVESGGAPATVNAQVLIDSVLANTGSASASVSNSGGSITEEDSTTSDSTAEASANLIRATAVGNNFENDIDLFVSESDEDGDGTASLGLLVNTRSGASDLTSVGNIDALVDSNAFEVDFDDFESGSVSANLNTIEANASANTSSTALTGVIPNDFTSTAAGQAILTANVPLEDWLFASGSFVDSTLQIDVDPGVSATATGNAVALTLESSDPLNTITAGAEVDGNTVASNAQGNSSNSLIGIEAGGAPTFVGTAVVTNGQINVGISPLLSSSITALTEGTDITATIEGDDIGDVNQLLGSLSVDGNTISASASGNEALGAAAGEAGNRILLADGVSFLGAEADDEPGVLIEYDSGAQTAEASADLIILSSQGNTGQAIGNELEVTAVVADSNVEVNVQAIDAGSVSVSENESTAFARGNVASSALETGGSAASFTGSAAVASQQTNYRVEVSATNVDADIEANVAYDDQDTLPESTVTLDGNTIGATAYGNQVSQVISLEPTGLDLTSEIVNTTGGTAPDGNLLVAGGLTITNVQSNYRSSVVATEGGDRTDPLYDPDDDGYIGVTSGATQLVDSDLSVTDNTQEAVAAGSTASNSLTLTATTLEGGAGIGSLQILSDPVGNNPASVVTATSSGLTSIEALDPQSAALELTGNTQWSIAYGGSVSNTLAITGVTAELEDDDDSPESSVHYDDTLEFVLDGGLPGSQPEVQAAYAILNIQSTDAAVSAITLASDGQAFLIDIDEGDLEDGSEAVNESNTFAAAAYGNESASSASLDIGTLNAGDEYASVLNVTNVQSLTAVSEVYAEASGGPVVLTEIAESVEDSSVSTSLNKVQALAFGNLTDNSVSATGTNIDTEYDTSGFGDFRGQASVIDNEANTDASFGLNNVQAVAGAITATTLSTPVDDEPVVAIRIVTAIGASDDFDSDVEQSSVVSDGNTISAGATGNRADNSVTVGGGDGDEVTALASTSALTNFQISEAQIAALIGIEGDDAPNEGGVFVEIGDDIIDSTVSVSDNLISGSVAGNSATNAVSASGTNVADGSDHFATWAIIDGDDTTAWGDHQLANVQVVLGLDDDGFDLSSQVYGTFAIDLTSENLGTTTTVEASNLRIDGNTQSSRAVANTAENSVALNATNTAAGAALASNQSSSASVNAESVADLFAPVASAGTGVSISDNTNQAQAVINNVTNTLTVKATNADGVTLTRNADLDIDTNLVATGDHILGNQQFATTSVTASAVTNIYNDEAEIDETDGLLNGSVTVAGNVTIAEASANRAINAADVSASASLVASAGVANLQISSADVSASAATNAGVALAGDSAGATTWAAVDASSITLGANTTSSLARGNAATNVLNYAAGANYGATSPLSDAGSNIDSTNAAVSARAAVLNVQSNTGGVEATSEQSSYVVALNNDVLTPTITNATIGVIGNTVSSVAYGNTAGNMLTSRALNSNQATLAVTSSQFNSGPVTATTSTVIYGVTSGLGAVSGSALSVTSNAITATAVGNNVINTIATN
jgi:hypothetical protein